LPTVSEKLQTIEVPTPTSTSTATATATFTRTPTLTLLPSLTASPTPSALFDKAQVTSLSSAGDVFSIVVNIPGLKGAYNMVIDARKFTCVFDAKYPDRLFCSGSSQPGVEKNISLVFTDPDSGQEIYSGTTVIIRQALPTETPAGYFSCPNRGKNVFCEVECRIYDGSNPCLVATCLDDCGLYYSLDTCPGDRKNTGICSEDLERSMRQQYGLPPRP
jgi:hypothetical protein